MNPVEIIQEETRQSVEAKFVPEWEELSEAQKIETLRRELIKTNTSIVQMGVGLLQFGRSTEIRTQNLKDAVLIHNELFDRVITPLVVLMRQAGMEIPEEFLPVEETSGE